MLDYKNRISLKKLTQRITEIKPNKFKTILKKLNMDLNINQSDNSLWMAIKLYLEKEHPNPRYESVYYLRKNNIIKNPDALPLMVKSEMIRCQGTPPKYAVEDILVLEFKAVDKINPVEISKIMSYMNQLESPIGLMINFNVSNIFSEGQKTYVNERYRRLDDE